MHKPWLFWHLKDRVLIFQDEISIYVTRISHSVHSEPYANRIMIDHSIHRPADRSIDWTANQASQRNESNLDSSAEAVGLSSHASNWRVRSVSSSRIPTTSADFSWQRLHSEGITISQAERRSPVTGVYFENRRTIESRDETQTERSPLFTETITLRVCPVYARKKIRLNEPDNERIKRVLLEGDRISDS